MADKRQPQLVGYPGESIRSALVRRRETAWQYGGMGALAAGFPTRAPRRSMPGSKALDHSDDLPPLTAEQPRLNMGPARRAQVIQAVPELAKAHSLYSPCCAYTSAGADIRVIRPGQKVALFKLLNRGTRARLFGASQVAV